MDVLSRHGLAAAIVAWMFVVTVGCDSRSPRTGTGGAGTAGGDAGGTGAAGGGAGGGGGAAGGGAGGGAAGGGVGGGGAGGGREPQYHRPARTTCNTGPRPMSSPCSPGQAASPTPNCTEDSDCSNGSGGRCLLSTTIFVDFRTCRCSYDTCGSDADCATGGPCHCAEGPRTTDANSCRGGNCQVDADCGQGRYCSPTRNESAVWQRRDEIDAGGYYCHTPTDVCVDDVDCPQKAPSGSYCAYSNSAAAWTCHQYLVE